MKKKIALVTGCAGFIGSNLVQKLLENNYRIIGVDNYRTGKKDFIKKFIRNSLQNIFFSFLADSVYNIISFFCSFYEFVYY